LKRYLKLNPGKPSKAGVTGSLITTWGNISGTGTGGTGEALKHEGEMDNWMGTWVPHVKHHDSDWKE
jgi:hypothetical protein